MNLIIVDKCTNYCKYCFASTEMAKGTAKAALQAEKIPAVLEFIRNSGPNFSLNIIGGEPFLYRQLPQLLQSILELKNVSKVSIFTGGIVANKVVRKICHLDTTRINFLFNINEKKDYKTEREYKLVLKNFDLLLSHGFKATFGYNIYENKFDYDEILELCREYGSPALRWTIAFPELTPNTYTRTLAPESYEAISGRVAAFLEKAYHFGIDAVLDCPVPKCFFDNEQLGRISLTQPYTSQAIKSCGPVIDVTPDLDVFRCYALSDLVRAPLTDFRNFQEVIQHFEKNVDETYNLPRTFTYCSTCEFALNRTCFGGCIAHSPESMGSKISTNKLLQKMYIAFQGDNHEELQGFFLEHKHDMNKHPVANYLMSFVAEKNGDQRQARTYIRKSIMFSHSSANIGKYKERLSYLLNQTEVIPAISLNDA